MNINKKIEEIRQKPEHIRIRYVWGAVAISMLFILSIWVTSLQTTLRQSKSRNASSEIEMLSEKLQEAKKNAPNIPSLNEQVQRIPVSDIVDEIDENNETSETDQTFQNDITTNSISNQ